MGSFTFVKDAKEILTAIDEIPINSAVSQSFNSETPFLFISHFRFRYSKEYGNSKNCEMLYKHTAPQLLLSFCM